jgi:hypothetical protein
LTLGADIAVTATFAKPPSIKSVSPAKGEPGATVTVNGSNLNGTSEVKLNGESVSFSTNSASRLTFTVPADGTSGAVSVTTPIGTATSSASFGVVVPPPVVTSFSPSAGVVGATVTISGAHLYSATAVTFNGTAAATVTVLSTKALTAVVPPGATTGTIAVTTSGGTQSSKRSFAVIVAPSISGFTPSSAKPGKTVTISGSGFTGTTAVTFGGKAASFHVLDDGHIRAVVPQGATTGPIAITNPAGTTASDDTFTVT